jgi:AraC-like DNA-binding protein
MSEGKSRKRAPLSKTCCLEPKLWIWPGQALYAGPSLELGIHAGSVACLAVGIDDTFSVETAAGALCVRSALIAARTPHRIVAHGARMAFCYLDPGSIREASCRRMMRGIAAGVRHDHELEDELIRIAGQLSGSREAVERWRAVATPVTSTRVDSRVRAAARQLVQQPADAKDAAAYARAAGLSPSRFLHLFRDQTGTSFRRYRLWARMLRAGAVMGAGRNLTAAAIEAGFCSPSHFSSAFHGMFGLRPSHLLATGLKIIVVKPWSV